MPIYISMLRGINVGGHKRIKMDRLRQSFEALGFEQVQTYIQSGNVVFKAGKVSAVRIVQKNRERESSADFGFSASVISRTSDEIDKTIANNPFLNKSGIDPDKLHVMFLSEAPTAGRSEEVGGPHRRAGPVPLLSARRFISTFPMEFPKVF